MTDDASRWGQVECPCCGLGLRKNPAQTYSCVECSGLFVPRAAMKSVMSALRSGHDIEIAMAPYRGIPIAKVTAEKHVGYKMCPSCLEPMNRTEILSRSGVVVDMCISHGVWFDKGELSQAHALVKKRGKSEALDNLSTALGKFFK